MKLLTAVIALTSICLLVPAAARAATPTTGLVISPTSGMGGTRGKVTEIAPCPLPPAGSSTSVFARTRLGNGPGWSSSTAVDGAGHWFQGAGYTIFQVPYSMFGSNFQPSLGDYTVTVTCEDRVIATGASSVTQTFPSATFTMTAPSPSITVAPASLTTAGGQISYTPTAPCPTGTGEKISVSLGLQGPSIGSVFVPVAASGAWGPLSASIPADVPQGRYTVYADCKNTDGTGLTYSNTAYEIGGGVTPPSQGGCADVAFIALAGSGQSFKSETDLSISPQLERLYSAFTAQLAGRRSVRLQMIDYPAPSVNTLTAGAGFSPSGLKRVIEKNAPMYLAGEAEGVGKLWGALLEARTNCPTEQVVLAGYSQGAMAIRDLLPEDYVAKDATFQRMIRGVVLLADPERLKKSQVIGFGDAPNSGFGLCDLVKPAVSCTGTRPLIDVPAVFRPVATSVCFTNDPVCDTSDLTRSFGVLLATGGGRKTIGELAGAIHSSYSWRPETTLAGKRAARLIQ